MIPHVASAAWPNALDVFATIGFLALVILLPAAGYVFMFLDLRAYVRSLRRGLVHISHYVHFMPGWARHETPRAVAAFGLRLPCSEGDLKQAYRKRVLRLHPDHGGDQRRFMILQANFEEALAIVVGQSLAENEPRWSTP